jgi:hypothetical protein
MRGYIRFFFSKCPWRGPLASFIFDEQPKQAEVYLSKYDRFGALKIDYLFQNQTREILSELIQGWR